MSSPRYDVVMRIRHPGATMDLVVPVNLVCNTTDEMLSSNVYTNSRRPGDWIKVEEPHDGTALVCGSGPSLIDTLPEIRQMQSEGAKVFALNGAANFLYQNGLMPDYQVIVDARIETLSLVGPAKEYLFASQVHPALFEAKPEAKVWHQQMDDVEDQFPPYERPYALVGGAAAVGVSATCLAFTLGYRDIHCFGLDSSNRGEESHVLHQAINDDEPAAGVSFNGKNYQASFTMKSQAERFLLVSGLLEKAGCKVSVHGSGLLPDMFHTENMLERAKYEAVWNVGEYRIVSPGEMLVSDFIEVVRPTGTVVDFGCGTGRGGLRIKAMTSLPVILLDFTRNSRDPEAMDLPFVHADLGLGPLPVVAIHGYCCDVMEHIPPNLVEGVLKNIMDACIVGCFFAISTVDDALGGYIGQKLHLTVKPMSWWKALLLNLGYVVKWSEDRGESALFYVEHNHDSSNPS